MATLKDHLDKTQQYLSRIRDSPEVIFDGSLTSYLSLAGMNCRNLQTAFAVDNLGQILVDMQVKQQNRFNGYPIELAALKRKLEGSQRITTYFFEELENKVYSVLNLDWEGADDHGEKNITFIDKMAQFGLDLSQFKDQFEGQTPYLSNPTDLAEQFSYLSGELSFLHQEMKQRYGKNKQMETLRKGIQNNWNQIYHWIGSALEDAYRTSEPRAFTGNIHQQEVPGLYLGN